MARWLLIILFPLWLSAALPPPASALEVPRLQGRVNDHAKLLTPEQAAALEAHLRDYEEKTTNQIALLTVPSLEGEALEDFTIRVGREWQLGQAKRNNGVLLFIAQKERAIRIEVGYGLEGALTDAQSSIIIRNILFPAFRQGDFNKGIREAIDAIEKAIAGEFTAPPNSAPSGSPARSRDPFNEVFSLGLIFIILFSSFLSYLPLFVTGLVGLIVGGMVGLFFAGSIFLYAGIGFVIGILLPMLFRGSGGGPGRGLGGRAYRGSGWSAGRGWGGGGGFSGGGGGFSGGGGSFGGGASGRW